MYKNVYLWNYNKDLVSETELQGKTLFFIQSHGAMRSTQNHLWFQNRSSMNQSEEFSFTWMAVAAWSFLADLEVIFASSSLFSCAERLLAFPHFCLYFLHRCWITTAAALHQKIYRHKDTYTNQNVMSRHIFLSKLEIYPWAYIWREGLWRH